MISQVKHTMISLRHVRYELFCKVLRDRVILILQVHWHGKDSVNIMQTVLINFVTFTMTFPSLFKKGISSNSTSDKIVVVWNDQKLSDFEDLLNFYGPQSPPRLLHLRFEHSLRRACGPQSPQSLLHLRFEHSIRKVYGGRESHRHY